MFGANWNWGRETLALRLCVRPGKVKAKDEMINIRIEHRLTEVDELDVQEVDPDYLDSGCLDYSEECDH